MRKIKFRVWDNIVKKFDDQIYNAGEQFGHPSSCDWYAQQYTGLLDKNGKEIFDGDILEIEGRLLGQFFRQGNENLSAWPKTIIYTWIAKVIWDEGCASFLLEYINKPIYQGRGNFKNAIIGVAPWGKIIGNIFENPELLN